MRGLGLHVVDGSGRSSSGLPEQGTQDAEGDSKAVFTSPPTDAAESNTGAPGGDNQGALVLARGATVSNALQAMAERRHTHAFVVGDVDDPENEKKGKRGSNASEALGQVVVDHRSQAGKVTESREATDHARGMVQEEPHILYAKDVISLLSPTSSPELGMQWKGFFDNVVGLPEDNMERTHTFSKQESLHEVS